MLNRSFKNQKPLLLVAITSLIFLCFTSTSLHAQFAEVELSEIFGGGVRGMSSSSVINSNGVKTTKINDDGKRFEIIESDKDGIKIKFSKTYGVDNIEELQEDHPDLYMHVSSFPTDTEGGKVLFKIEVIKEKQSQDVKQLEKEHPEAFKIYKKYNRTNRAPRVIFGGTMPVPDFKSAPIPSDTAPTLLPPRTAIPTLVPPPINTAPIGSPDFSPHAAPSGKPRALITPSKPRA